MHSQSNGSKVPSHNLLVTTRLFETFILSSKKHFSQRPTGADVEPGTLRFLFSLKDFESLSFSLFTLPSDLVFSFHKYSKLSSQFFKFQILNSFFCFIYLFILLINRCHFRLGFASLVIEFFNGCSTCKSSSRLRLPHKAPSDRR